MTIDEFTAALEAVPNQPEAARLYARQIREVGHTWSGWPAANRAIRDRWPKGLVRVKRWAWKIIEDGQRRASRGGR